MTVFFDFNFLSPLGLWPFIWKVITSSLISDSESNALVAFLSDYMMSTVLSPRYEVATNRGTNSGVRVSSGVIIV